MTSRTSDELRLLDASARHAALTDFSRPMVIEAGAGTGKTATLVGRIVAYAMGPGWIETQERHPAADYRGVARRLLNTIVAITFTEAAAAEMAGRVAEALAQIAVRREAPLGMATVFESISDDQVERAAALANAVDHLEITTIHAFCRRILAAYPLEAGLHPRLEVDADGTLTSELVHDAVERWLVARFAPAEVGVLEPEAAAEHQAMLALSAQGLGPTDLVAALTELLGSGLRRDALGDGGEEPFRDEAVAWVLDELHGRLQELLSLCDAVLVGNTNDLIAHQVTGALRALNEALFERSAGLAGLALVQQTIDREFDDPIDEHMRRYWARGEGRSGEEKACFRGRSHLLRTLTLELREALFFVEQLNPALVAAARKVLNPLLLDARERQRAAGFLSFDQLLEKAFDLITKRPDVARALRSEISQLLVDEFQDTDDLQCHLVRHLTTGDNAPCLFVVGDPKQSIYGWRNADMAAYQGFVDRLVRDAGARHLRLYVNYRSVPAILDEVNRTVAPVMVPVEGLQPAYAELVAARSTPDAAPTPVEHWVIWPNGERRGRVGAVNDFEARVLVADLIRLRDQGTSLSDVGLLFRSTTDLDIYLGELRQAGVPYVVERDRNYFKRREVIDATALVRAIVDPTDHLALLAALRTIWVGVPDAALIPLWTRGFPGLVSRLGGQDEALLAQLDAVTDDAARAVERIVDVPGLKTTQGFERPLQRFLRALSQLRRALDEVAADRFVELLRDLLLVEPLSGARYLGAYRVANLERFFSDLVAALEAKGADPNAIIRRLTVAVRKRRDAEEAKLDDPSTEAVRVMTVHRSKGLAFHHVYVLQAQKTTGAPNRGRQLDGANTGVHRDPEAGTSYRLMGLATPGWFAHVARRARVEAAERVRLLYVALTRARDRLVVSGRLGEPATIPWHQARTLAELVAQREGGIPTVSELERDVREAGQGGDRAEALGATWVLPWLRLGPGPRRAAAVPRPAVDSNGRRPPLDPDECAARAARSWSGTASGRAHDDTTDRAVEGDAPARDAPVRGLSLEQDEALDDNERARAVGTAVHWALEHWELSAPVADGLARAKEAMPRVLGRLLAQTHLPVATAYAHRILEKLATSDLLQRLRELDADVVAHELPVLLPAIEGADEPVGFVSGAIDLLYIDPATNEWVVADYKTDRIHDAAALAAKTRTYRHQGAVYQRAVRDAFQLDHLPRFELWFIDVDQIVVASELDS